MQKRIYRSKNDKIIAGICGGLAKYFEVDPAIVRIIFILLFFFKGIGFLVYLIMWIVVPYDPNEVRIFHAHAGKTGYAKTSQDNIKNEEVEEAQIIDEIDETGSNEKNGSETAKNTNKPDNRYIAGIVLIIIGGLFLLNQILPSLSMKILIPIILVIAGIYLLINSYNGGGKQ